MLDNLTLDQMRVLIAVAEEGSFPPPHAGLAECSLPSARRYKRWKRICG